MGSVIYPAILLGMSPLSVQCIPEYNEWLRPPSIPQASDNESKDIKIQITPKPSKV